MGAFMYFFLILSAILFIGGPLVLFQLMLETAASRADAGRSGAPSSAHPVTLMRYAPRAAESMGSAQAA